jgi:hypothetical protein
MRTRPTRTGTASATCADDCVAVAHPRITPQSFQRVTGGQLDQDQDGYGNVCDADFDNDGDTDATDHASHDLDGNALVIGSPDLAIFNQHSGSPPGPKCALCPLP